MGEKFDPHAPYAPMPRPKRVCAPCGGWGYSKDTGKRCQFCGGTGVRHGG